MADRAPTVTRVACLALFTVALGGCATAAQGPVYSHAKADEPNPHEALVYVFREHAEPTAWGARVQVDGKDVAMLNERGFTWVYARPGTRTIKALWPALSGQQDSQISIELAPGLTYYVELTGISRMGGFTYVKAGSGLHAVDGEAARARLARCCRYQKPL